MINKNPEPLKDISKILPIIDQIPVFGGLSDKQLNGLFSFLKIVKYDKDELIFEEGTSPSCLYIIENGRVRLVRNFGKSPLQLIEFEKGHSFGDNSLIGIEPHTATAVAMEDTELIILTGRDLHKLYETDKDLYCMLILNIARELSRRLNQTEDILLHYFSE